EASAVTRSRTDQLIHVEGDQRFRVEGVERVFPRQPATATGIHETVERLNQYRRYQLRPGTRREQSRWILHRHPFACVRSSLHPRHPSVTALTVRHEPAVVAGT